MSILQLPKLTKLPFIVRKGKKFIKKELILPPYLVNQMIDKLSEKVQTMVTQERHNTGENDIIFDVPHLSEYLNVSPKWIYEQTHLKTIPHYKIGNKQLRFRKIEIQKWIDGQKVPPAGNPKNGQILKKTRMKD
jgi:excisionase family DNA binding protein